MDDTQNLPTDTQATPATLDTGTDAATVEQPTVTPPKTPDYAAENARLTAELAKQQSEFDALNTKHTDMVRREELKGKVTDINLTLKVLDPERHLNSDGTVNVYAIYDDYPSLAPSSGPTAPDGGGGPHSVRYPAENNLEQVARTGNPSSINSMFDTLLKGGRK